MRPKYHIQNVHQLELQWYLCLQVVAENPINPDSKLNISISQTELYCRSLLTVCDPELDEALISFNIFLFSSSLSVYFCTKLCIHGLTYKSFLAFLILEVKFFDFLPLNHSSNYEHY